MRSNEDALFVVGAITVIISIIGIIISLFQSSWGPAAGWFVISYVGYLLAGR